MFNKKCVDPYFGVSFWQVNFWPGVTILGSHVLPQERLLGNHIVGERNE